MYVNGKMIPVETIPGMEGKGIYCKNFCECHNIPHRATLKHFKLKNK
jgi:hypothetical protein